MSCEVNLTPAAEPTGSVAVLALGEDQRRTPGEVALVPATGPLHYAGTAPVSGQPGRPRSEPAALDRTAATTASDGTVRGAVGGGIVIDIDLLDEPDERRGLGQWGAGLGLDRREAVLVTRVARERLRSGRPRVKVWEREEAAGRGTVDCGAAVLPHGQLGLDLR